MVSFEFLVTSLVVVLVPGAGVVCTVTAGLMHGRAAGLYAALGCTLGILPHLLATILGLAAILHASAVAFQLLKFAGAAYLLYLAYATWRDRSAFALDENTTRSRPVDIVIRAMLINSFNPKLTIFFMAFLPQFVAPGAASGLAQLLLLGSVFMAMTLVVFVAYGCLAHAFRRGVVESPRVQGWLRRGVSAVFAGLGMQLAFAQR